MIEYESGDLDVLLTGQSPLGEVLATPSALALSGIAVCLIDVADDVRRARLRARDGERWSAATEQALIRWAAWHRGHADDPQHRPDVIVDNAGDQMRWERWTSWRAGDPRWLMDRIDTTNRSVESCATDIVRWVEQRRADHARGLLPLRRGWVDRDG